MGLVSELRRRNVLRMVVLYAVAAWLIMQVGEVVVTLAALPNWTGQVILVLLAVGFPIALALSWFYELTPEGISLEKDVKPGESITHVTGRRLDFLVISLLCAAVIMFAYDKWWIGQPPERSIAVLPFANRSANEDDAFFVDGIHDDLLSHISKIGSIKVISRTSVLQYRDTTKTIPQIAEELGVATVLEGGVQRAGEQVRINVQLIDARKDEHLWSEIYDRQLSATNIFTIQSEIATAIAEALRAALSPEEQDRLENVPTENMAALEAYFLGKQRLAKSTTGALAEAVDHFQQSIELDPKFALAYVGLANTYFEQVFYSGLPQVEMLAKAKALIDKSFELDERSAAAHAVLGRLLAAQNQLDQAEVALRRAIELNPNYATAYSRYGGLLVGSRRPGDAVPLLEQAVKLDPVSPDIRERFAAALREVGRTDEALAELDKAIQIDPTFSSAYRAKGVIHLVVLGRYDLGILWYRRAISLDPGSPRIYAYVGLSYLMLGDEDEAQVWIDRAIEIASDGAWSNEAKYYLHLFQGEFERALTHAQKIHATNPGWWDAMAALRNDDLLNDRFSDARARYQQVHPELFLNDPDVGGRNLLNAIDLALVLQQTGENELASKILEKGLEVIQVSERLGGFGYRVADAQIYALLGRKHEALSSLRQAYDAGPGFYWRYYLGYDPNLASLRDEPEFQALAAELRADMAAQLERVREMEASGELEPIPDIN